MTVRPEERVALLDATISLSLPGCVEDLEDRLIHQDLFECIDLLPASFIDLAIVDPPYNLDKRFGAEKFSRMNAADYEVWLESWVSRLKRCLKPTATIYVCSDWQSSNSVRSVLEGHFKIRNRITWEREKGRGAAQNWKNCSEDIWFCTMSNDFYFDVNAVKLKRRVLAPYRDDEGAPKDWEDSSDGQFRLTNPSNLWTDLSVPFWSMPENTDHPTQKPEKLMAKLVLASSKPGDLVFDPFFGSGTACVVAKKLKRKFSGVEREPEYCEMAVKRLALAELDGTIQGYFDGCFWDRNSLADQKKGKPILDRNRVASDSLFDV